MAERDERYEMPKSLDVSERHKEVLVLEFVNSQQFHASRTTL